MYRSAHRNRPMLGVRRHDMNPSWKHQLVPVNIGAQRLANIADQRSTPFGGQLSDRLGYRQRCKVTGDELPWQWERRRLDRWAHAHVPEASRADEIVQCRGVMKRAGGARAIEAASALTCRPKASARATK
jgi:hypothetical protein